MALTVEIAVILGLVGLTACLFITEWVRADVTAVLVLALLGVCSIIPGLEEAVSAQTLFSGFASDAVMAMIAVMIIGAGLDRTGIMNRLAAWIVALGGATESRILSLLTLSSGLLSAFIQNGGLIALLLPVVSRVASRTGLATSRLLIPVGFAILLGGTITLVGCSPLILLNELIRHANRTLPADQAIDPFGLFSVAPVGLALLGAGGLYLLVTRSFTLPRGEEGGSHSLRTLDYYRQVYGLDPSIHEVVVPRSSSLIGTTLRELQLRYRVRIIATHFNNRTRLSTPVEVKVEGPAVLAVIGDIRNVHDMVHDNRLRLRTRLHTFLEPLLHTKAGIAELVIPPTSDLIGKSARDLRMRETYRLTLLAIHRAGRSLTEGLPEILFQAGDTLVCHTAWDALSRLEKDRDFVVITSEYPHEEERPHKLYSALGCFTLAMALVLLTDIRLGAAMLIGAIGMVMTQVLNMDEAYEAVSWKTVFLMAGLMPLGQAVQHSGAAAWIAAETLFLFGELPPWGLQVILALMASLFSMLVSNVGATILLVPVAVQIALGAGAEPAHYALIVALGTSNCFLIPTNQVSALIMGPGNYRSIDFIRAGSGMTLVFLVVSLGVLNLMY